MLCDRSLLCCLNLEKQSPFFLFKQYYHKTGLTEEHKYYILLGDGLVTSCNQLQASLEETESADVKCLSGDKRLFLPLTRQAHFLFVDLHQTESEVNI